MIKAPGVDLILNDFSLLCNSPYFVFAAQGWSELVNNKLVSNGGYSLDSKCPGIALRYAKTNEIVGVATYTECMNTNSDTYFWVDFIYVAPAARELGVYKALMTEIENLATAKEALYVEFGTKSNNHPMQAASKRIGYKPNSVSFRKYIGEPCNP